MRRLKIFYSLLVFSVFLLHHHVSGQTSNNNCASAAPFCTGQTMNFPATTNVANSQVGPNYGCLNTQPNPAWFFMQINQGGPVVITMSALQDIDFICWGPFASMSGACNNLTAANTIDCSYSSSNTETCTIANAIPGAFYLLLITNFANINQNISFNQTNGNATGAGNTNCGFVCVVTATNSGMICTGMSPTLSINAATTSTAVNSFSWTGPGGFNSNSPVNVLPLLNTTSTYTVKATASAIVGGSPVTGTCQSVTTITVIPYPAYTLTPSSLSICQGGNLIASVVFTTAVLPGMHSYSWSPNPGGGIANPAAQNTFISPPLQPTGVTLTTLVYTVVVRPIALNCSITKTLDVTIHNPLTPTLTMPAPVCDIFAPLQMTASPAGGSWSGNPAVSPSGILSPALAVNGLNFVFYSVAVGTCVVSNSGTFSVSKFHSPSLTSNLGLVCVQDPVYNLMNLVLDTVTGYWQGTNVSNQRYFSPSALPSAIYNFTYNTSSTPIGSVCPSSTVLAVQVFNPPTPTIAPINPVCNTAATVALVASPPGGFWSGSSAVSFLGVQSPILAQPGNNFVTYTSGQGTCVVSAVAGFHVSQFRTAALTATFADLCVNSNPINLFSIVQNNMGTWSGTGVNNATFSPAALATNNYILTYLNASWPDAQLCPDSRTFTISVLNPPTPNIKQSGPYCTSDAQVQLTVTPVSGKWTTFPYLTVGGLFTPSLALLGSNLVEYVIGTPTCNAKHSRFISLEAFIPALITGSIADLCSNYPPVNLTYLTPYVTGYWTGAGMQGNDFNPGLSGSGNIFLSYHTSSFPSGLCPDQSIIAVKVFSLATPAIYPAGPYCDISQAVQLTVTPLGGIFGGGKGVNNGGIFIPGQASLGDNLITYTVTSGPCIAFAESTVSVEKFVSADFSGQPEVAYCRNNSPFNLNTLAMNPIGNWSGPGVVGNMFDPAKSNIGGLNNVVHFTHSEPHALLCPDSKTLHLKVDELPKISLVSSKQKVCTPEEVTFNIANTNNGLGGWNLGDGSGLIQGLTIAHIYKSAGTYSVIFNYTLGACQTQTILSVPITVLVSPIANFEFSKPELDISDPEVDLINRSTDLASNRYVWTIQEQGERYEIHPRVKFPKVGHYNVTLQATSYEGCRQELSRLIEVKSKFSVFIPNSFTPNQDGLNDNFKPVFSAYGLDSRNYELEIYDRWGHLVFHGNDAASGWDGTVENQGEEKMKEDIYVFRLRFRDLEGRIYYELGHVTLLNR